MARSCADLFPLIMAFCLTTLAINTDDVHLIDSYTTSSGKTNFLLRGPAPVSGDTFDWTGLQSAMNASLVQANMTLPSDYYLIDICLLTIEKGNITVEQQYFSARPYGGLFQHWPTLGTPTSPGSLPISIVKLNAINWSMQYTGPDLLPYWIPRLYATLTSSANNKYDIPTIIYVHCILGEDRTGEISGSYYIQYKNMSFAEALQVDNTINPSIGRPMDCISLYAMQWYCFHLLYTNQYSADNCTVPASAPPCSYDLL